MSVLLETCENELAIAEYFFIKKPCHVILLHLGFAQKLKKKHFLREKESVTLGFDCLPVFAWQELLSITARRLALTFGTKELLLIMFYGRHPAGAVNNKPADFTAELRFSLAKLWVGTLWK